MGQYQNPPYFNNNSKRKSLKQVYGVKGQDVAINLVCRSRKYKEGNLLIWFANKECNEEVMQNLKEA
jgi:hypothetical protein